MTVLYLIVRVSYFITAWLASCADTENVLDTLYWNPISRVCLEAKNCRCANSSSLTISVNALRMSHTLCVRFF
jgi:hypothetical protein